MKNAAHRAGNQAGKSRCGLEGVSLDKSPSVESFNRLNPNVNICYECWRDVPVTDQDARELLKLASKDAKRRCPHDGAYCHHHCKNDECFREKGGMSLSKPWEGYPLPEYVRSKGWDDDPLEEA